MFYQYALESVLFYLTSTDYDFPRYLTVLILPKMAWIMQELGEFTWCIKLWHDSNAP